MRVRRATLKSSWTARQLLLLVLWVKSISCEINYGNQDTISPGNDYYSCLFSPLGTIFKNDGDEDRETSQNDKFCYLMLMCFAIILKVLKIANPTNNARKYKWSKLVFENNIRFLKLLTSKTVTVCLDSLEYKIVITVIMQNSMTMMICSWDLRASERFVSFYAKILNHKTSSEHTNY